MTFKRLLILNALFFSIIITAIYFQYEKGKLKIEKVKYEGPKEFQLFHQGIRTREGDQYPKYLPGQQLSELAKAKIESRARRSSARLASYGVLEWKERGPANVPGRTRGLAVMPSSIDASGNTWLAGSSGGGIWKTTNGGTSWQNKSANFPSLAVATLAICTTSPNIVYAGTGEYIASAGTAINGNGIFKSIDSGETWSQLASTANNSDFISMTRVIVDPLNPDLVLACSAPNTWGSYSSTIMRSTNGGASWTKVFDVADDGPIEQIIATPGNFNIQYASQNGKGVLKSIDAGQTWSLSNVGMSPSGRLELAVSPVNTNHIFASTEGTLSGSNSDLYMSTDAGMNWSLVNVSFNNAIVDFLGGQGWYDNTIACDPFNANVLYFGGASLFKVEIGSGSTSIVNYTIEESGTTFMALTNFGANLYGGRIKTGSFTSTSVEVRFGPNKNQLAHRFTVPSNGGSNSNGGPGVPDNQYTYQNYVQVPFEVWEVDNNGNDVQQLMVSFRDQQNDGIFNLNVRNDATDPDLLTAREYIFIHGLTYSAAPSSSITVSGGQTISQMYFFWPTLSSGVWDANTLPESELRILVGSTQKLNATTSTVADVYGDFDSKNEFNDFGVDIHPDQHNMMMIPMSASTYKILLSNDGGVFLSNISAIPGTQQGDWTMVGKTYNTSQFYGADKRPGFDEYFGGMQDNGTWRSPANVNASSATNYIFAIGGDGFEVLWNSLDDKKLIGGSQGNAFRRSINGGGSWSNAVTGLSGTHPFISKLASNKNNPDVIFTVSSSGVFRSENFGSSWTLTPITEKWSGSTFLDVEVSRANANIVWAGSGMSGSRSIHASINGGLSFTPTNNYTDVTLGSITKLASHPYEPNTAYALFSFANTTKVLRTTNLGQTWEDISGFGANTESSNGFPDVAVYCLYVRPDNPAIIWVGTEIGIVESQDNGLTWALLEDFPNASVWDMKGQDDQVVIATHGRGIWTATINATQANVKHPQIIAYGTSPKEKLIIKIKVDESFDKVELYDNTTKVSTLNNVNPSECILTLSGMTPGNHKMKFISYKGTGPHHSKTVSVEMLDLLAVQNAYSTYFESTDDLIVKGFTKQTTPGAGTSERKTLQTPHNYSSNVELFAMVRHPIKVSNTLHTLQYEDIAIVEPGLEGEPFGSVGFKDYVVMEATKNGLDWIPLQDGYNARHNAAWLTSFTNNTPGSKEMFVHHEIDLTDKFSIGDTLLIRYRLYSDDSSTGWGAALNYITIQQEPTATENPRGRQSIQVLPNPTDGNFTVQYELQSSTDVTAQVLDMFGRIVLVKNLGKKEPGIYQQPLSVSSETQGTYFLVIRTREGNKITKISVKR